MTTPTATRLAVSDGLGYSVFRLDPPLDGHDIVAVIETDTDDSWRWMVAGIYPADETGQRTGWDIAEYDELDTPPDALRRAGYEIVWEQP